MSEEQSISGEQNMVDQLTLNFESPSSFEEPKENVLKSKEAPVINEPNVKAEELKGNVSSNEEPKGSISSNEEPKGNVLINEEFKGNDQLKTVSPAPQVLVKSETQITGGTSSGATSAPDTWSAVSVPELPEGVKASKVIGGAPLREWINEEITPYLLEAMRTVSKERPEEPLRFLGEFLLQKHEQQKVEKEKE